MEQIDQDQVCGISINNLPPEMLQMVLQNLDASSLFACRVVCQKWKEMANHILRDRPETELSFSFNSVTEKYQFEVINEDKQMVERKESLADFMECLLATRNHSNHGSTNPSPFARFALFNIQSWDESVTDFLSAVSPTAICLKLQFIPEATKDASLTQKLRNLLLHETPVLNEFGLDFEPTMSNLTPTRTWKPKPGLKLTLFPSVTNGGSTTLDSNSTSVKLPKLKTFHIGQNFEEDLTVEIYRDILNAAPNLRKIQRLVECDDPSDEFQSSICVQEDFAFFLECGKLYGLKRVYFNPNPDFLCAWKNALEHMDLKMMKVSSFFKFEDFNLSFREISHIKDLVRWRESLQLLEQIFEGGKDSLYDFRIFDVEFPPGFKFPTFTKLSTVSLGRSEYRYQQYNPQPLLFSNSLFPPGCRFLNIFPNVKTLDLYDFSQNLKHFFPLDDSIPVMPSVHTITLEGVKTKGEDVEIMALLCPNMKTLKLENIYSKDEEIPKVYDVYIGKSGIEDFPSFGLAVWKSMKNLEYLHLIINADAEANKFPALDSTLTGISKENCLRLFEESTDADVENLDDDENSTAKSQRETELKGLKVNESILDLPKLKELNIRIHNKYEYCKRGFDAVAYKICVEEGLSQVSRVSQLYALKLIPGLKYEITGEAYEFWD